MRLELLNSAGIQYLLPFVEKRVIVSWTHLISHTPKIQHKCGKFMMRMASVALLLQLIINRNYQLGRGWFAVAYRKQTVYFSFFSHCIQDQGSIRVWLNVSSTIGFPNYLFIYFYLIFCNGFVIFQFCTEEYTIDTCMYLVDRLQTKSSDLVAAEQATLLKFALLGQVSQLHAGLKIFDIYYITAKIFR